MAIIINNSKARNYNYASLSDIAAQGYEIPKMKTESEYEEEFVYYYDAELKEWIRGAKVVIPEAILNKDGKPVMNKAQLYGSALTYARRYTALLALQLCCSDDSNLEDVGENNANKGYNEEADTGEPATEKQLAVVAKLGSDAIANILNHFGLNEITQLTKAQASEVISRFLKKQNEQG